MPYVLGVDVGGSTASAAICRLDDDGWTDAAVVRLGAQATAVDSALLLAPDGTLVPHAVADAARHAEQHRSIRGYIRRVGDDVPLMIGNRRLPAHDLTAFMIRWVVDRVWDLEGEQAEQIMFACPAGWRSHREGLLRKALHGDVPLIAAPLATTAAYTAFSADAVGVFAGLDLGGSACTVSVIERHSGGAMEVLSSAELPVGAADLDDALVAHVRARAGLARGGLGAPSAMAWLRSSCAAARERLSDDEPEAVVPVPVAGGQLDVVVTRDELADLARPLVQPAADTLARLVRAACPEAGSPAPAGPLPAASAADGTAGAPAVAGVLLAGGGARTPGLAESLAERLPGPIRCDPRPDSVVARGAALAARRVVQRSRAAARGRS